MQLNTYITMRLMEAAIRSGKISAEPQYYKDKATYLIHLCGDDPNSQVTVDPR